MALPWSSADLSATLDSLLKLDELMKCSKCHETPPLDENGVRLVKTGLCGHTICSGVGCTEFITGDGDKGDKSKCPAVGCNKFIRDFVEDREESSRLEAVSSLKGILLHNPNTETMESIKPSSPDNEPKSYAFMEPTQEPKIAVQVKNKRSRRVLSTKSMNSTDSQNSFSTDGDDYIPTGKAGKKSCKPKTPQTKTSNTKMPANHKTKTNAASLNKKNKRGETPLHCACIKLNFDQAESLIKSGANPNTQDNNGWTPLHEVAQRNHVDLLCLLLDAGANPNIPGGDDNYTPLHDAADAGHVEIIKLLIERGADKNVRDITGIIPAQLAKSDLVLEAMETDCEITNTQLDTTISSAASLVIQAIVVNPHPLISRNQEKLSTLRKWERKFKDGNVDDPKSSVKLEMKEVNLSPNVTHYVVFENDNENCDKLEIYDRSYSTPLFEALLMGAWILKFQWITDSLKEGRMLSEEVYQVKDQSEVLFKVAKNAMNAYRSNTRRQLPRLLDGMNIFMHGSFQDPYPNKNDLLIILEKGGAKILKREPDPESIPQSERTLPYYCNAGGPLSKCSHYILYQDGQESGKQLIKYNMEHLKAVSVEWLFACLNNAALIDLEDFVRSPVYNRADASKGRK